ncbi:MAG TPA: site-specific integrase [Pirellulaceae bacterium]|nr:site-specific integrase [Pirellulaceae bacterium]
MAHQKTAVPSYCRHKASGQAVVRLDGVDRYLGPYGSPESYERYERAIAEWRVHHAEKQTATERLSAVRRFDLTVSEVLFRYRQFALGYYQKNGQPSKELQAVKYSLRPVRLLYGSIRIRDFGPLALKAVREHMVSSGLCRNLVNARINRVKRFMKWAVSEELAPPSAYEALRTVTGLRFGRSGARETDPVQPVPDAWVNAVLPFLSPQVKAMVSLQRLTGMRPCEVVQMRVGDIDMTGEIWIYEPPDHKNRWRGHKRLIPLGPKSQEIIRPFLSLKTVAFLFSPIAAEAWRNDLRRQRRQTPMTPSQAARRPKSRPKRAKRERYDVDSYRRAIEYGIEVANRQRTEFDQIPHWFPLQLRHSRATEVRKAFGLEGAQVALGHANASVTEVYAERNLGLAIEIAKRSG